MVRLYLDSTKRSVMITNVSLDDQLIFERWLKEQRVHNFMFHTDYYFYINLSNDLRALVILTQNTDFILSINLWWDHNDKEVI